MTAALLSALVVHHRVGFDQPLDCVIHMCMLRQFYVQVMSIVLAFVAKKCVLLFLLISEIFVILSWKRRVVQTCIFSFVVLYILSVFTPITCACSL